MLKYCNIEYLKHRVVFDTEQVDLVICDALNRACVEAAKAIKIPSVITASLAVSPGKVFYYYHILCAHFFYL